MEWRKCSTCKSSIEHGQKYYLCSVSTCNSKRTGYVFCQVSCFDQHIPGARHKDAGAIEEKAPVASQNQSPKRRIIPSQKSTPSNKQVSKGGEILVIASRFKDFVNQQSDFNTSARVMEILSDHLRHVAMQAVDNARSDGRKTLMEQDLNCLLYTSPSPRDTA